NPYASKIGRARVNSTRSRGTETCGRSRFPGRTGTGLPRSERGRTGNRPNTGNSVVDSSSDDRCAGRDTGGVRARGRAILHSRRIAHWRGLFLRRHALFLVEPRAPNYRDPKTDRDTAPFLGQTAGRASDSKRAGVDCDFTRPGTLLRGSAGHLE